MDHIGRYNNVLYSDINLDGGNVVLSPSKEKAIISDRVFSENPEWEQNALILELEKLLGARIIIIPSLTIDMTGHTDGMVRFVDEDTVIGNAKPYRNGLEQRIKTVLIRKGIVVVDFPYYFSPQRSTEGCYLNFLETAHHILLPTFGHEMDGQAVDLSEQLFPQKEVVLVQINEIAAKGGCLNCISWEL